jgi:hypothetical protein
VPLEPVNVSKVVVRREIQQRIPCYLGRHVRMNDVAEHTSVGLDAPCARRSQFFVGGKGAFQIVVMPSTSSDKHTASQALGTHPAPDAGAWGGRRLQEERCGLSSTLQPLRRAYFTYDRDLLLDPPNDDENACSNSMIQDLALNLRLDAFSFCLTYPTESRPRDRRGAPNRLLAHEPFVARLNRKAQSLSFLRLERPPVASHPSQPVGKAIR